MNLGALLIFYLLTRNTYHFYIFNIDMYKNTYIILQVFTYYILHTLIRKNKLLEFIFFTYYNLIYENFIQEHVQKFQK